MLIIKKGLSPFHQSVLFAH